jgi:hypothetical protein
MGYHSVTYIHHWVTKWIRAPQSHLMWPRNMMDILNETWYDYSVEGNFLMESLLQRIQIMLADNHPIHDKLTEYFPSTCAQQMLDDIIDSLEQCDTGSFSKSVRQHILILSDLSTHSKFACCCNHLVVVLLVVSSLVDPNGLLRSNWID